MDTSVLICGLISPLGHSGTLVSAVFEDRLKLAYTRDILAEYADVMARDHFKIEARECIAVMTKLRASNKRVTPVTVPTADWPDEDDLPFVAAALATEDKIIVTLNPRDFAPAKVHGVSVLTSAQAVARFLR